MMGLSPMDADIIPCAICKTNDHVKQRQLLADGKVFECVNCGFVFFSPIPLGISPSASDHSVQTADEYTAGMLQGIKSQAVKKRFQQMAERRHQIYKQYLGRSNYRLLEVGCGTAELGPYYADLGVHYHGIDIDYRCVEAARRKKSIIVEKKDFFEFAEDKPFDVICFSQVLEHIVDPLRFVEKAYSQLTSDGVVHCDVPNQDGLGGVLSRLRINSDPLRWGVVQYPHHLFAYRKKTLLFLFSKWFNARVFSAVSSHPCWGQPRITTVGAVLAIYQAASKVLQMHNFAVLIGKKRAVPLPM